MQTSQLCVVLMLYGILISKQTRELCVVLIAIQQHAVVVTALQISHLVLYWQQAKPVSNAIPLIAKQVFLARQVTPKLLFGTRLLLPRSVVR